MTSQYVNWDDTWTFLKNDSAVDIDAMAVANLGAILSEEISLDGYAGVEFGVASYEDNTGAPTGYVNVYVLGYGATGWQTIDDDPALVAPIQQAQNATRRKRFSVPASRFSSVKILTDNQCGQEVAVSIKYKRAKVDSA